MHTSVQIKILQSLRVKSQIGDCFARFHAIIFISTIYLYINLGSLASASTYNLDIKHPLENQVITSRWLFETEKMAISQINYVFEVYTEVSNLSLTILGMNNGELIPISVTTVTRQQWQKNPKFGQWTRYISASQSLLLSRLKHDKDSLTKSPKTQSPQTHQAKAPQDPAKLLDEAFDTGRLTQQEYQELIDALD